MVERSHQADVFGQQHAVAENVAGHVTNTSAGEILGLRVAAQRPEMALHRFPRTTRGNAHALVVVTDRTTGRERIAHPETMGDGQAVGNIGEGRRALVCGHHQVRVVVVVAYHAHRRHDLVADDVVGDVQQALDEHLVAGNALGQHRIAVTAHRGLLDEEAALRTDWHDDRVLHHLCLHQAQHFRAEILATVGPAQATTCHRAEAQVHALNAWAVDEDLAIRTRLGQVRHLGRIQLEADRVRRLSIGTGLVIAGAQGGFDHADETAQDAVVIQAGHAVHQFDQRLVRRFHLLFALAAARVNQGRQSFGSGFVITGQALQLVGKILLPLLDLRLALVAGSRIEACFEQLHQQARQQRIAVQGFFHVALRKRHAGLQQILAVATQQRHLAPRQASTQHQLVESVVLRIATPDACKCFFKRGRQPLHVEITVDRFDFEFLDVTCTQRGFQPERMFGNHPQAHVFHQRQRIGQRDVPFLSIQVQAQAALAGTLALGFMQAEPQVIIASQCGQVLDVACGAFRRYDFDIARRQCTAVASRQQQTLGFAMTCNQAFTQVVLPVAQQVGDIGLECGGIHFHLFAGLRADGEVQLGQG